MHKLILAATALASIAGLVPALPAHDAHAGPLAYVLARDRLVVLDTTTQEVRKRLPLPVRGAQHVVVSPDGRQVFVRSVTSEQPQREAIIRIDVAGHVVSGTFDVPPPLQVSFATTGPPRFSPDGARLYVPNVGSLVVMDTASGDIVGNVVGVILDAAVAAQTGVLYVVAYDFVADDFTIVAIDPATLGEAPPISLHLTLDDVVFRESPSGISLIVADALATAATGSEIYVRTPDGVRIIDPSTGEVLSEIAAPSAGTCCVIGLAPDGSRVFVEEPDITPRTGGEARVAGVLDVIDVSRRTIAARISHGRDAFVESIQVDAGATTAYLLGSRLLQTNRFVATTAAAVSAVDLVEPATVTTLPVDQATAIALGPPCTAGAACFCTTAGDCDDGDPCTREVCGSDGCSYTQLTCGEGLLCQLESPPDDSFCQPDRRITRTDAKTRDIVASLAQALAGGDVRRARRTAAAARGSMTRGLRFAVEAITRGDLLCASVPLRRELAFLRTLRQIRTDLQACVGIGGS